MKTIISLKAVCILFGLLSCFNSYNLAQKPDITKLQLKAKEAKQFCVENDYNTDFFLLVDLSVHSGLKRFFVWDFEKDTVTNSFLVSHGCGKSAWSVDSSKEKVVTSNVEGSHCSSLGKYRIGDRGYSQWGIHIKYLLHGLEATNNNALKRDVVLHSWNKIEDEEVFPAGTPESWGCPAVSNNSMQILDDKLINAEKNVLMWIIQ